MNPMDDNRDEIRRRLKRTPERYPLTLPHSHIRRIVDHRASVIVLTRAVPVDTYEIHDAMIDRRNARHRDQGRTDLQSDPFVFAIEIAEVTTTRLLDLDLITIRRTGFETLEDFYRDWLKRQQRVDVEREVHLCSFSIASDSRFLHKKVHRGYTRDPSQGAPDEPEALSREDLDTLARAAAERWERERQVIRDATPLTDRIRALEIAASEGDQQAQRHLFVIRQRVEAAEKRRAREAAA